MAGKDSRTWAIQVLVQNGYNEAVLEWMRTDQLERLLRGLSTRQGCEPAHVDSYGSVLSA